MLIMMEGSKIGLFSSFPHDIKNEKQIRIANEKRPVNFILNYFVQRYLIQ